MPYVSKKEIEKAREMDLLTYLERFEPEKLVDLGGGVYCTREHDSLKISNGKWSWWSRGTGGHTALDYLVVVEGMTLPEAVCAINGTAYTYQWREGKCTHYPCPPKGDIPSKSFVLPPACPESRRVFAYLCSRGIDPEIINHCIRHGLLYEEAEHHNAVFVGHDQEGVPRYATMRGTLSSSTFLQDVAGSNKRHCFSLSASGGGSAVFVFESAIDALSHAVLDKLAGRDWRQRAYLSLGGVSKQKTHGPPKLPAALAQYLREHPGVEHVALCLDADEVGRGAAEQISSLLSGVTVWDRPPRRGKDYNEQLQLKKGIVGRVQTRGHGPEMVR